MREGWVETTLGSAATLQIGRTPTRATDRYWTEDLSNPFCTIADMDGKWVMPSREGVTEAAIADGKARRIEAGSLLMSFKLTLGRVGFAATDLFPNEAIVAVSPNSELTTSDFLYLWLGSQNLSGGSGRAVKGETLNSKSLALIPVVLPPLAEQRRIVDVIESVDNYITALETRAKTLSELSGSLVAAIFQSPESKVVSLGSLCEAGGIQIGPFGSQLHASDYVPFGVPSVMPRDLTRNGFDTSSLSYVSEKKASELSKHQVAPGDILFARRGDLNKRALVTDSEAGWLCGTGTVRVRLTGIEPRLAFFALTTPEVNSWLTDHAVGATMPNLNSQIVANIPVRIPANPELAIAAIGMTNKACGELTNTLATSKRLRTALLSALLSGNHEIPASYDQLLGAA